MEGYPLSTHIRDYCHPISTWLKLDYCQSIAIKKYCSVVDKFTMVFIPKNSSVV